MRPLALTCIAAAAGLVASWSTAFAESGEEPDRSQSPYFVVKGADNGVDTMPLMSTRADIDVSGTIARVKVTQVYKNSGQKPLEAIYVFPGSTRAAVYAMRMTVGDRVIEAEIQKKDDARKMYEDAKNQGKTASLLEQQRPNVFQMSVANILPGDLIKVEMNYTELLVPTDGSYEVVYPAVVGPRYTGESTSNETWTAQPTTHAGEKPSYDWDVAVHIAGGMPIQKIASSSHPITTTFDGPNEASVVLANKSAAGTKDFVLQYKLAGEKAESGLLLYPGEKENFFLAMVQPPARVDKAMMPKREYIFIVDVSGSMWGFPIDTAKKLMNELLDGMNENDRFNILCFSGGNLVLAPESLATTPENIEKAKQFMAGMQGGGGTEILGALREALAMKTPGEYARTFVAVTDGYVSVEPQVFRTIRENLGKASFFAFGIGSSVNRFLIEGMARSGMGEPFIVMHDDDAVEKAAKLKKYIDSPVLTDIKVKIDGLDAYDIEPINVPDLFASRPVMVFGKYRGAPRGTITVSGIGGRGAWSQTLPFQVFKPDARNEALRYLWARHRIATLADYQQIDPSDDNVKTITQLGLDYNLMTAYTSFVAIDQRVRNSGGKLETVNQPLPLPDGVSDLAVGGAPTASAPRTMGRGAYGPPMPSPAKAYDREEKDMAPELEVVRTPDVKTKPAVAEMRKVIVRSVHDMRGGRSAADVKKAIQALVGQLASCLAGQGVTSAEVVSLEVTVDASGHVTAVRVVSTGAAPATLGKCFAQKVGTAVFAAGDTTTFYVDLTLAP
ncbi:MAG: VIT domain-containing protein [Myxococcota bacterium]